VKEAAILGVGFWSAGYGSAAAWLEDRRDASVIRPKPRILDSRIGRYTSLVTRMAIETLLQAADQGGVDLSTAATVFGSARGEVQTAFEQLDMIEEVGFPSPSKFKNSVHNTAGGHLAIACGNMGFSTSLAAGDRTFAMCLLEALCWLDMNAGPVIVSVADESLPPHLQSAGRYTSLSVAFAMTRSEGGGLAKIKDLRRASAAGEPPQLPSELAANPSAIALHLMQAVLKRRWGVVPLEPMPAGWCVDVTP